MKYEFRDVTRCNMCGAPATQFGILGRRMNVSQGLRPRRRVGIATTVCRCAACGLVFTNPMPVPLDLAQHYGSPPEDYWKEDYFVTTDDYFSSQIATWKKLAGGSPGRTVLDVGSGIGKGMVALGRAGLDAWGLEPGPEFRRYAIERLHVDPERLRLGPVDEVSFDGVTFDWITFGAVLEHLFDPGGSLSRVARWLRSGGLIHAEVPSSRWMMTRLMRWYYRLQGLDYVINTSPMHSPYHLYEFAIESFERWCAGAGFEVAMHRFHPCDSYLPRLLDPLARRVMAATDTGMQLEVWLRKKD